MYSLLLLNGGIGTRVGADQPKQFLTIRGIPILIYPLTVIDRVPEITQIVMNYPPGQREKVEKLVLDYSIRTPVTYVEAGNSRHESVAKLLPHAVHDRILIHEAARPLITDHDLKVLIEHAADNISLTLPLSFTVAPVNPESQTVSGSLERDRLRNVQLPQKFLKADLEKAHQRAAEEHQLYTEDATLLASHGVTVHFTEGSDKNFKVTTPVDLRLAHFLLQDDEEIYD